MSNVFGSRARCLLSFLRYLKSAEHQAIVRSVKKRPVATSGPSPHVCKQLRAVPEKTES
jgi:hypothetical protein